MGHRRQEADLIIGSSVSMPALVAAGKVNRNSLVVLCKTGIGIVSAKGLDVSVRSVEDFKRVLLNAKAIVYADPSRGGAAGIHVAKVIEQLGLTGQIKPKVRLAAGGDITEVTLSLGPTALGMTQISEIADKPQAELVGRLPKELQNYTEFMAGVTINTTQLAGANALLRFFKTHKVSAVIRAKGMEGFASSGGSE